MIYSRSLVIRTIPIRERRNVKTLQNFLDKLERHFKKLFLLFLPVISLDVTRERSYPIMPGSVVEPKYIFFFPDPDPILTIIPSPDPDSNPDPACLRKIH
jgi:hypothetical protein